MFSVSCRLGQVRVVGLMSAISVRKSSIAAVVSGLWIQVEWQLFFFLSSQDLCTDDFIDL